MYVTFTHGTQILGIELDLVLFNGDADQSDNVQCPVYGVGGGWTQLPPAAAAMHNFANCVKCHHDIWGLETAACLPPTISTKYLHTTSRI